MARKVVPASTLRKVALKSRRASARLERREVPEGFRRTVQVENFVAKRQKQG
ncbi:hypothetical protein [Actinotalea sp. JY-7876]|uniref:hypothetical protein n=1 Tax=Actinotalea sp. JY-7876 TaxID=2758442 RepID=UPI0015F73E5F|nr:hypothetical protein [Actinotalea sp. JY-7876]